MSKWEMVRLGDVGVIITGNTPRKSDLKNYETNDIPFYKPGDFIEGRISSLRKAENNISTYAKKSARILPQGSVLVTCIGIIGKIGVIQEESACNQQINAIIPDEIICFNRYLSYAILHINKSLNDIANSAVVPIINKSQFSNIIIPLPPLDIQKKIATALDSANALIEKRKEQIEKLDLLIKSQFIEMFGDPVTNPKGWEKKHLEEIANVGSSRRVFVEELVNEGVPFYRGTEIGAMGTGESITPSLFITSQHYDRLKAVTGVPVIGDLLMPSICPDGRIWRVNTIDPFYFKDGRVLWVHFTEKSFDNTYLLYALKERIIAEYMNIASGTTFAELKIFSLKRVSVLLPPLVFQTQFAEFVQKVEAQKALLQKSLADMEQNYQSLLQKCFKGEIF